MPVTSPLLRALIRIKFAPPAEKAQGICHSLDVDGTFRSELYDLKLLPRATRCYLRNVLWPKWPRHSGHKTFPVPHPYMRPDRAFNDVVDLWNRNTAYGKARYELLDFTIAYLEEHPEHDPSRTRLARFGYKLKKLWMSWYEH